jgi:hypothetical protein
MSYRHRSITAELRFASRTPMLDHSCLLASTCCVFVVGMGGNDVSLNSI